MKRLCAEIKSSQAFKKTYQPEDTSKLLQNIFKECYSSCASDDEEEAFACWTDNCGLTFFNTENQRGICYPEICSPAEVMIVTSRYSADLITSGMSGVLGSETAIAPTTDVTTGKFKIIFEGESVLRNRFAFYATLSDFLSTSKNNCNDINGTN